MLRGGNPPRVRMDGVEHSTPVLHPSLGWSKDGKRGGAGWSTFFRISVCSTPVWGGAWGGRDETLLRRRRKNVYLRDLQDLRSVFFLRPRRTKIGIYLGDLQDGVGGFFAPQAKKLDVENVVKELSTAVVRFLKSQ